jgi:surface polysaccharide O-acyltransferase-like enzyme
MSRTPSRPAESTTSRAAPSAATPAPSSGDLAWIGWLRLVAITGVVFIHVGGATATSSTDPFHDPTALLATVLDYCSRWAVPVFVMLSGALLLDPARYRDPGEFLRKRAVRLLPAVVFWHLVYVVYVEATTGPIGVGDVVQRVLTGRLYTALYFFWIVIGLAVVTPLLLPWVASATRRARLIAAAAALAVPVLMHLTVPLRFDAGDPTGVEVMWVQSAWTWWIPYVGYYLLGRELRDVVLTGGRLALAWLAAAVSGAVLVLQWGRVGRSGPVMPTEAYYSVPVIVLAVCVLLIVHSLVRPGGLLGVLCRPRLASLGRQLGAMTLGVYGVHLLIRNGLLHLPWIGGGAAAPSIAELLARCAATLVLAYAVAMVLRKIPVLRQVV